MAFKQIIVFFKHSLVLLRLFDLYMEGSGGSSRLIELTELIGLIKGNTGVETLIR